MLTRRGFIGAVAAVPLAALLPIPATPNPFVLAGRRGGKTFTAFRASRAQQAFYDDHHRRVLALHSRIARS